MVTDRQVRKLMSALVNGGTLQASADKSGMNRQTARRYRDLARLPSALKPAHDWRTREDGFAEVWPWVAEQLAQSPGLEAKTLFESLQRQYPGRFADGQLRTLQRRVRQWRAESGPAQEVFFAQAHHPGRLGTSDFTHMKELGVTINGARFEHLLYHFVLTYSNWETFTLCYSESFESLAEGLQNALWELGGVPEHHRSDRFSAAVHNTGHPGEFTKRYRELLAHYGRQGQRTNPNSRWLTHCSPPRHTGFAPGGSMASALPAGEAGTLEDGVQDVPGRGDALACADHP